MNAVAIISFDAYDAICEFLGANWYAVLGTLVLAGGFAIHIIYAFILTFQNRKARGNNRYAVNSRPKNVEWASQNMLVLGLIVCCFLILHLVQFWAKMQLPELMGDAVMNGTHYLEATFCQVWVLPVYLIGFAALWFHISCQRQVDRALAVHLQVVGKHRVYPVCCRGYLLHASLQRNYQLLIAEY